MASSTIPTGVATVPRGRPIQSASGTVAPLNTPTRRFYGSHDQIDRQPPGVPNPNIYVVQPFKNASVPKDLVYAKKNAPNPGEALLNSTMSLINHFTSCYEAVKHQLQDEHTKSRESALISRAMTTRETTQTISRTTVSRPAKQAKLLPLMIQPNDINRQDLFLDSCVGISPVETRKDNDLTEIYEDKLRMLRQLKPEFFDSQGNLLSSSAPRSYSFSQASAPSSKKSVTSSFRTPHNTVLSADNVHFDDRRTFLTEMTNEDEDRDEEEEVGAMVETVQPNSINEFMNKNYVIKVLEIKTISAPSVRRDRTKSGSDHNKHLTRKGNMTAKST